MKKNLTLLALMLLCIGQVYAYNSKVVLINPCDGKEYNDGSTIYISPDIDDEWGDVIFPSPSIRNKGNANTKVTIKFSPTFSFGFFESDFGTCQAYQSGSTYEKEFGTVKAGGTINLLASWSCWSDDAMDYVPGECVCKMDIYENGEKGKTYIVKYIYMGGLEKSLTLNKSNATLFSGQTLQLFATKIPTSMNVTWSSSNTSVATVSKTGLVTAQNEGTTTITVANTADSSVKATCRVTVKSVAEGLYRFHNKSSYGDEYLYESNSLLYSSINSDRDEWLVEAYNGGYSIKNTRTGHYISDVTGGESGYGLSQLTLSSTPVAFYFTKNWESIGYYLRSSRMINADECVNAAGWGTPVGTYVFRAEDTSEWLLEDVNSEILPNGYYFITNPTRGTNNAVYEDAPASRVKWGNYTIPSKGNIPSSDAKYVWKISMNNNGKYTIQNVQTKRFMNKADKIVVAIPTTENATETFSIIPARRTTKEEGHWILNNSSTATAGDVSGYCSGLHAAVAYNSVVQWGADAPASHWDLIKLSEEEVTALESTISISQTSVSLSVSQTLQLRATINPRNMNIVWSSSNTSVATVSSTGLVTAKKEGTATITVAKSSDPSVKATCMVHVVSDVEKAIYYIRLNGSQYYFNTAEVEDNATTTYSISTEKETFEVTPQNDGFVIKSIDSGKYVGHNHLNSWCFSNDADIWYVDSFNSPTTILKDNSKGFGVDEQADGAGVFTDKIGQYWIFEPVKNVGINILRPENQSAARFDIQGRRVDGNTRGILIQKGIKILR